MKANGKIKWILGGIALVIVVLAVLYPVSRTWRPRQELPRKSQLQRIHERGYLLAATDKNTLNYFIYRGEAFGYQLNLLESFARYLGVPLRIIASNDISRLQYYLHHRAVDILALNLPVTPDNMKLASFSQEFGETRLVAVQRRDKAQKSLAGFSGDTLYVKPDPYLASLYSQILSESGNRIVIQEVSDTSQIGLVKLVAEGKIRMTLCGENLSNILKRTWTNLDDELAIGETLPYAWGISSGSDSLSILLNHWIDSIRDHHVLQKVYTQYFDNQNVTKYITGKYSSINAPVISPYDQELRSLSTLIWWDWRLIASLMYEESNFMQGQVSHRNASGLMQMVPETAEKFGLDSTAGPARQIAAGIRYLIWIDHQLPGEINHPMERISFILASYNVGIGRVLALRKKAEKFGKDPNRWHGHVEYYLLKRSRQDPYGKTDFPDIFPVNYSTEGYVDGIISRYYHYRNLIPRDEQTRQSGQ